MTWGGFDNVVCLVRPCATSRVFSVWVSLTTLTRCKWPRFATTETCVCVCVSQRQQQRTRQSRCVMGGDLFWLGETEKNLAQMIFSVLLTQSHWKTSAQAFSSPLFSRQLLLYRVELNWALTSLLWISALAFKYKWYIQELIKATSIHHLFHSLPSWCLITAACTRSTRFSFCAYLHVFCDV